jgi:hypothetical protein
MQTGWRTGTRFVAILSLVVTSLSWTLAAQSDIPPDVRRGLEAAMKSKMDGLLAEKSAEGLSNKRGVWSRSFKKIGEGAYEGTLNVDTAMGPDMKTERYRVTLKSAADGAWSIADEKLEDTYEGLHRGVLGDETCQRFQSFGFAREGLSIKATNGSLCTDFYQGKVARLLIAAPDLTYTYEPPIPKEQMMFGLLKKEKEPELIFQPHLSTRVRRVQLRSGLVRNASERDGQRWPAHRRGPGRRAAPQGTGGEPKGRR